MMNEALSLTTINLDEFSANALFVYLSEDESQRMSKYHFVKDKQRYIICRGILRLVLSKLLQTSPQNILFSYNQYGKPSVQSENNRVYFNLSHTKNHALLALSNKDEVGVDIEVIKPIPNLSEMIKRIATKEEMERFHTCIVTEQTLLFYRLWTRKEAMLKCLGTGFSYNPNNLNVLNGEANSLFIQMNHHVSNDVESYFLSDIALPHMPETHYCAAVAVKTQDQPKLSMTDVSLLLP